MNTPTTNPLKCQTLVIKIASRCNLNCKYCYMYNMGDLSFQKQPKVMKDIVLVAMMQRVKDHCAIHGIKAFTLIMHGGEPLLAGFDFFRKFVQTANEMLLPDVQPVFVLQTNGTMLTEEWCQLLGELKIVNLGISLDGVKEINDINRIDHAGRGSYDRIIEGLKTAQNSKHLKTPPAVLSVVNIDADPVGTYLHFKDLGITNVDFLIPDSTYEQPPPRPTVDQGLSAETPYADWMIRIFDQWFSEGNDRISIRKFELIMHMILGGVVTADNFGSLFNEVLVIETDGGIEAVDVLKICGDSFTKAGANVLSHSFEEAMNTDLANLYHMSHKKLCTQCMKCPVKDVCGGGYLPHRYKKENGFNNPTIYCKDMLKLITHIQNRVVQQLPEHILEKMEVAPLTFEEALRALEDDETTADTPQYDAELLQFSVVS